MAFTISALPEFEQEVEIPHYRHGKVTVRYKYMPPAELKLEIPNYMDKPAIEVLPKIILGWNAKDDNSEAIPYDAESLQLFLNTFYCGERLYAAWISGLTGAKAKN